MVQCIKYLQSNVIDRSSDEPTCLLLCSKPLCDVSAFLGGGVRPLSRTLLPPRGLWSAQGLCTCISSALGSCVPTSGPSDARPYISLLPRLFVSCPVLVKRHTALPILMLRFHVRALALYRQGRRARNTPTAIEHRTFNTNRYFFLKQIVIRYNEPTSFVVTGIFSAGRAYNKHPLKKNR